MKNRKTLRIIYFVLFYLFSICSYAQNCDELIVFSENSGQVEDGSGNDYYEGFLECKYLIEVEEDKQIIVVFEDIDINECVDFIRFYDGADEFSDQIKFVHVNDFNESIISSSNQLYFEFHTDSMENHQGWIFNYTTLEDSLKDIAATINSTEYVNDDLNINFSVAYENLTVDSIMVVAQYFTLLGFEPLDTVYLELDSSGEYTNLSLIHI